MFVGMGAAFGTYLFFNATPATWRWPGVHAADPQTHELIQPLTGSGPFQTFVLKSWLDTMMPFVPVLAIPYLSYLAIVPVTIPILTLTAKSLKGFFTIGWALIGAQLFMDLGYFLFQTWVERTQTPPHDFTGWLALIYPATVMLQQHYLIDVYAGIAIGIASYALALVAVERPRLTLPTSADIQ